MRGVDYGEFDHLVWVTMKKTGPVLANILLDGILREDLAPIASDEESAQTYNRQPTHPVEAKVTLDGAPLPGASVTLRSTEKGKPARGANGIVEAGGKLRL